MKIGVQALILLGACSTSLAFVPTVSKNGKPVSFGLQFQRDNNDAENSMKASLPEQMKNIMASTIVAAALWVSPPALFHNVNAPINNMIPDTIRTSVLADAKEMASGSGSRVNKDPESLLRLGLPIPKDKEVCSTLFNIS